jgi:hypothetical protein
MMMYEVKQILSMSVQGTMGEVQQIGVRMMIENFFVNSV